MPTLGCAKTGYLLLVCSGRPAIKETRGDDNSD
jgi:hypothetical protein